MFLNLSKDHVFLIAIFVRRPEIALLNGKKREDGRPYNAYSIGSEGFETKAKMMKRLYKWVENKLLEINEKGEYKNFDQKTFTINHGVNVSLNQIGCDFLLEIVKYYREICSVAPFVIDYAELLYMLEHNGAEMVVEPFEDEPPKN